MQNFSVIVKKPRCYAEEALRRGSTYYDYEHNFNLIWKQGQQYLCIRKIGRGKYSQVFESVSKLNSEKCVVKILKPIKFKKINREIKILMALDGKCNTIKLLDIVKEGNIYCLIFEHVANIEYRSLMEVITPKDCRFYFLQVLIGLRYCHSLGIMHRDIKPQNVLIDHKNRKLRIIDWGLGEFYLPAHDYNVRVSSRYYKGPELLVGYEYYHYSLDIWSLGVMMAGIIFGKEPFFKGADNFDQLDQITQVLGTAELYQYVERYKIRMESALERVLGKYKSVKLSHLVTPANAHLATDDALDLIGKMMLYDHDARLTVQECINHPYFNEVRAECSQ